MNTFYLCYYQISLRLFVRLTLRMIPKTKKRNLLTVPAGNPSARTVRHVTVPYSLYGCIVFSFSLGFVINLLMRVFFSGQRELPAKILDSIEALSSLAHNYAEDDASSAEIRARRRDADPVRDIFTTSASYGQPKRGIISNGELLSNRPY